MKCVKWLFLDFQVNGEGKYFTIFLKYGSNIKLIKPDYPVTAQRKVL